ncbi:hypothetical protein Pcinc_041426 [Petrolisthes cinctipes]|uniref:Uncharacterized protein n=1 Tax=Petrolisthes cinctipes TaxID=88211 RepID=A0AAE1BN78_PETCI|nr:hypothetical protein Pcinc_041426 [Petrolisthes cinctipes]
MSQQVTPTLDHDDTVPPPPSIHHQHHSQDIINLTHSQPPGTARPLQPHQLQPSDYTISSQDDIYHMNFVASRTWPSLPVQALRLGVAMVGEGGMLMFHVTNRNDITWDLWAELINVNSILRLRCFSGDQAIIAQSIIDNSQGNQFVNSTDIT